MELKNGQSVWWQRFRTEVLEVKVLAVHGERVAVAVGSERIDVADLKLLFVSQADALRNAAWDALKQGQSLLVLADKLMTEAQAIEVARPQAVDP